MIPVGERNDHIWEAPVSKKRGYGFGQSLVWYGQEDSAQRYIEEHVKQIENYSGENWIDVGVD